MTRAASDVGAGLATARAGRPIARGERIHVVGAAGAGASASALLAAAAGAIVTGCDPGGPSPYTPALAAVGIALEWRHDPGHVTAEPRPDRLAVSKALTSIEPDHPELTAARDLGIPLEPWQQVVADAGVGRRLVAIAGTHGKSTTAGWLTHVLVAAGRDPSAFVGALLPASVTGGLPATARIGGGPDLVVEADEYAGNFDPYRPEVAVVTNVDWDHPDVFADRDAVVEAFAAWLERVPDATLVIDASDAGSRALLDRLRDWPGRRVVVRLGLDPAVSGGDLDATLDEVDRDGAGLTIRPRDDAAWPLRVRLAGRHNASNALLVVATALALGVAREEVARAAASFEGVGRRLERKGEAGGVVVYDDYGHHPTAIRATIDAVRQREPGRRLWVAHEPLTFHRTAALLPELAAALGEADGVVIADIWPGRDPDRTIASPAGLADAVRRIAPSRTVVATGDVEASADWLAEHVGPGDVVLVMGGGRSYRIAERLLERLGQANGHTVPVNRS